MKLTNQKIYEYAMALANAFTDNTQKLPVKVNFYLQKNKTTLTALAQDIENARMDVISHYGEPTEDGTQYLIPKDKLATAQQELTDLFALEQEVNIYTINIDSLSDDITLTTGQMEAIMFMID
jgi:aspartokinase